MAGLPDRLHLEVECTLNEAEVRQASKKLADTLQKRLVIEDRMKQEKAKAKAEYAALDGQSWRLSRMIQTERETREVLCEVRYDFQKGEKTFIRTDTGEIARVDKIRPAERQKEL